MINCYKRSIKYTAFFSKFIHKVCPFSNADVLKDIIIMQNGLSNDNLEIGSYLKYMYHFFEYHAYFSDKIIESYSHKNSLYRKDFFLMTNLVNISKNIMNFYQS